MNAFSKIREFFWPLLEKADIQEPLLLDESEIILDSSQLKEAYHQSINCYNSEMDRIKTIEGKSSLFIGTLSVTSSIILGITSVYINSSEYNLGSLLLIILLLFLIIYLLRTVWFSVKVLEREGYHTLSTQDFLIKRKDNEYYKKLLTEITNKTRKNSIVINRKVDNMTMAQEYFKRSIFIIPIYAIILFLIYISNNDINLPKIFFPNIDRLFRIQLHNWEKAILYVLVVLSLGISTIALFKIKKLKK
jgi:hypothetical protein